MNDANYFDPAVELSIEDEIVLKSVDAPTANPCQPRRTKLANDSQFRSPQQGREGFSAASRNRKAELASSRAMRDAIS
jgi:hypothetical protein